MNFINHRARLRISALEGVAGRYHSTSASFSPKVLELGRIRVRAYWSWGVRIRVRAHYREANSLTPVHWPFPIASGFPDAIGKASGTQNQ